MNKEEVTDEEYLVYLLKGYINGIEGNIACSQNNNDKPSTFMDGYVDGLNLSLGAINACLRLYLRKTKGEIPIEMLERVKMFSIQVDGQ